MLSFAERRGGGTEPEWALFNAAPAVVDAPEFRGITFHEIEARSILNEVPSASRVPFRWTINVYRGCTHDCSYCFARPTHTYLGFNAGPDFAREIVVKINAVSVLARELSRPSWAGEHVAMGTNTDPYQRAEGRYRLTRGVLEVLAARANPCSILTKSALLTRDIDVFQQLSAVTSFRASLSIPTVDEEVWRRSEPGAPSPRARLEAVRALREAGIDCGILIAPVLPGISDRPEQLQAVAHAAADVGATFVTPLTLHLRPGVREVFWPWLTREYPHLVDEYQHLYAGAYAPAAVRSVIAQRARAAWSAAATPRGGDGRRSNAPTTRPGDATKAASRHSQQPRQRTSSPAPLRLPKGSTVAAPRVEQLGLPGMETTAIPTRGRGSST